METQTTVRCLIADNIRVLYQAVEILRQIDDAAYVGTVPALFRYSLGGQLRHCLDAWRCFLRGISGGRIDYDQRERNPKIETSRQEALACLDLTIHQLRGLQLNETQLVLASRHDSLLWCLTSIERELQFLLSHTIHHYALMAIMLRAQGFVPAEDFGVAPSTLEYWKEKNVCVR